MNLENNLVHAHQIVAMLKMDDATYTHISIRNSLNNSFLISPFGPLFEEVKAEDLIELNHKYMVLSNKENFNPTGAVIHNSIYKARPEINAVIHLHTNASIAVSASKSGLLPISQHALHFYNRVSYHNYDSQNLDEQSQGKIMANDLGQNNVLILNNHGFVTIGKTIWEALFYAYHLEKACIIQTMMSGNINDYILPPQEICEKACQDLISFEKDLGRRDWEAWIRKLERSQLNS